MFCADGQTNGVWLDTLLCQFFFIKLAVGRCSRMNHQTFNVSYVSKQRENLQIVDKLVCLGNAAFDFKSEDGSTAVWEELLV